MTAMEMMVLSGFLLLSSGAFAQRSIPSGTILPVQLNSSLSFKTRPGKIITARIMQDAPLGNGPKSREGMRLIGHVVAVTQGNSFPGLRISFTFDKLAASKNAIPITTGLRAIASFVEVESAQISESGPDRGTPEDAWTTVQVGGDVVYRGGGPVKGSSKTAGRRFMTACSAAFILVLAAPVKVTVMIARKSCG